ncbi:MAG: helix-turn-helix domain-containing protein [Acidobacteriaceae bacterium]
MPDYEGRLQVLEQENAELRDRVSVLEAEIGLAREPFPLFLDLTPTEQMILSVLMKNAHPRKSTFMTALYSHLHDDERAEDKIIDVFICKIRPKLKPHGIVIETAWGQGYWLNAVSKDRVRELMAAA